ncbi:MAG: coaD [Betaproteobacteria bacterium]|nr:coaD [Betaproteobacteria bacterium]
MTLKAVFPGTFDPITLGLQDLVRRAASMFDEVILAVADSRTKRPFFTLEERVEMAKNVVAEYNNVKVMGFSGLLMHFAQTHGAKVVMRGLRAVSDFDYEFQLAGMNRNLFPEVESIFLTPAEQFLFISATLVREISVLGGDVSKFVSPHVEKSLKEKIKSLGGKG